MMETFQLVQASLSRAPELIAFILGAIILAVAWTTLTTERPHAGFPLITSDNHQLKDSLAWVQDGRAVLAKGLRECSSCFQVLTGSGYRIVVPNRFADELRNHPDLRSTESLAKDFFSTYPGFEGIKEGARSQRIMQDVIRGKLTQNLGLILDDLVQETHSTVTAIFGDNRQWQTYSMKQHVLDIVAKLSARAFQGEPICHDENWLRIAKDYTVHAFTASRALLAVHPLLRPLKQWWMPVCKGIRNDVRQARQILTPEIERRRQQAVAMIQEGKKPPKVTNVVGWLVEMVTSSNEQMDYVAAQLFLFVVAIHSTSETLSNCIVELCDQPQATIQALRDEIISVLREEGWNRNSLYKMKLVDSFLKETLRMYPALDTTMYRIAKKPVTLSDGTIIPSGARLMVSNKGTRDPANFTDPEKFDAARFLRLREQPGEEKAHQAVITTPSHMGFGHGQFACPGRFFASDEVKIVLSFLLLNYDMRFVPEIGRPDGIPFNDGFVVHPAMQVQVRRRQGEIDPLAPQTK